MSQDNSDFDNTINPLIERSAIAYREARRSNGSPVGIVISNREVSADAFARRLERQTYDDYHARQRGEQPKEHRKPYVHRQYPIPPWHEDCVNGDPVIQTELDFSMYADQVRTLSSFLYFDEFGLMRLDVKKLASEAVTLKLAMGGDNG